MSKIRENARENGNEPGKAAGVGAGIHGKKAVILTLGK